MAPGRTAVVLDHWPLVRLGISRVVERAGFRVVAECDDPADAVAYLRRAGAQLVVVGSDLQGDPVGTVAALVAAAGSSGRPRLLVLVDAADRERLAGLLDVGADAILVRTAGTDELADAIQRVLAGERVLGPALLPGLVGLIGPNREAAPKDPLTAKERAVLRALAGGGSNRDIAAELYLSEATVKTHLSHIYAKLGVADRQQAVAKALALRLLV